jgi:hypothetical protein
MVTSGLCVRAILDAASELLEPLDLLVGENRRLEPLVELDSPVLEDGRIPPKLAVSSISFGDLE